MIDSVGVIEACGDRGLVVHVKSMRQRRLFSLAQWRRVSTSGKVAVRRYCLARRCIAEVVWGRPLHRDIGHSNVVCCNSMVSAGIV